MSKLFATVGPMVHTKARRQQVWPGDSGAWTERSIRKMLTISGLKNVDEKLSRKRLVNLLMSHMPTQSVSTYVIDDGERVWFNHGDRQIERHAITGFSAKLKGQEADAVWRLYEKYMQDNLVLEKQTHKPFKNQAELERLRKERDELQKKLGEYKAQGQLSKAEERRRDELIQRVSDAQNRYEDEHAEHLRTEDLLKEKERLVQRLRAEAENLKEELDRCRDRFAREGSFEASSELASTRSLAERKWSEYERASSSY